MTSGQGFVARRRRIGGELGEAEVEYFETAVGGEHDVGGLEVAVHDAARVGGRHRVGERDGDVEEGRAIDLAVGEDCDQRAALDQLHGEEVSAGIFLDRVDGDDAGVVERGQRLRFAAEALEALWAGLDLGRQHLECNATQEPRVERRVDLAHTALAQERFDRVGAEPGAEPEVHRCGGILPGGLADVGAALVIRRCCSRRRRPGSGR